MPLNPMSQKAKFVVVFLTFLLEIINGTPEVWEIINGAPEVWEIINGEIINGTPEVWEIPLKFR